MMFSWSWVMPADTARCGMSTWAAGQQPTRQTEVTPFADLAAAGKITAFPVGPWGATGFIVGCPIIARL